MKALLLKTLKISRPRFWHYYLGTYIVGFAIGAKSQQAYLLTEFWLLFLYFLFPANLLVYSVNDLFDFETDTFNTKKGSKEYKTKIEDKVFLKTVVFISLLLSLGLIAVVSLVVAKVYIFLFVVFGVFYSAKPIRLKSKPILDSLSNIFYVFPGIVGYYLVGSTPIPINLWIVFVCWTFSMHLFSAIPDVIPDKEAGIKTTAVLLGITTSKLVCFVLWFVAAFLVIKTFNFGFLSYVFLVYPFIALVSLFAFKNSLLKVYWKFPAINGAVGFVMYWYFTINNLYL